MVCVGDDGLVKLRASSLLDGFDIIVGRRIGAEYLVVHFALKPQPDIVLINRCPIDPASCINLGSLCIEQQIDPPAGKI